MFNRANLLIVAVAVLGAALGLYVGSQVTNPQRSLTLPALKPGERLTDLQLLDSAGQARRLGDWNGKLVLVNFWATWCGPCREEMPLLDRTRRDVANRGLEVVGIAVDDTDAVTAFLKDSPVKYPILVGGNSDMLYKFGDGSGVLPYSVLLGRDGKMLAQRAGSFSESSLSRWLQPHLAQ